MKRSILKRIRKGLSILAVLLFANSLFWAQNYSNSNNGYQGRVVRLSLVEGDVSIQHGPNDRWLEATINAPLAQGDRLWVGAQGRTEIEFDDGSFVRLGSNSVLEIQQLDLSSNGRYTQVFLSQGLGYFNIRENYNDTFRVTTPSLAADAYRAAKFRLAVDDRNDLTVFRGEVRVNSRAGDITVRSQQTFSLSGDDSGQYFLGSLRGHDDWDRWNFDRDDYLARATSYHYLPSSVAYGAYDLDRYGHWVYQNGYGYVWAPYNVPVDWVPYSYGRWAYYPAFGYSWVSYEPWGWLPYHYGGWAWIPGFGWAWAPGTSFGFWSPARVFFFHSGGFVGWCPFSPFDTFFGGATFININVFRPRNFFRDRVVIVNNNTFINNVVTQQTVVRNREVLTQLTTSNNLQFAAQPQVQRTAVSEVLRPASIAKNSNVPIVSDTKGWGREDGIRGTGARPSENLRNVPAFGSATSTGTANREIIGNSSGGDHVINNRDSGGQRSESLSSPGNNSRLRSESEFHSPSDSFGRSANGAPGRNEGTSREVIQGPSSRMPYSSNADSGKGRVESRAPGAYIAPPSGPRSEGLRSQSPLNEAPRTEQFRAPAPRQDMPRQDSRPSSVAPEQRREERPKSPPPERNESRPPSQNFSQENFMSQGNGRSTFNGGRSSYSYAPPARVERAAPSYSQPERAYTPPVQRNESRSNFAEPRERYSPPAYSAPAPRYEAPQHIAPRFEAPRQSYSPPPMPRENFSRPSYSAPSYSHSTPSFHSAPAPRSESRSSGGGSAPRSSRRE